MAAFQHARLAVTRSLPGTARARERAGRASRPRGLAHRAAEDLGDCRARRCGNSRPAWSSPRCSCRISCRPVSRRALSGGVMSYPAELSLLWPGAALRQSILLLLVWTHGCIGLHQWLKGEAWWRRARHALAGLAALVPAAALAGFVVAGREVARTQPAVALPFPEPWLPAIKAHGLEALFAAVAVIALALAVGRRQRRAQPAPASARRLLRARPQGAVRAGADAAGDQPRPSRAASLGLRRQGALLHLPRARAAKAARRWSRRARRSCGCSPASAPSRTCGSPARFARPTRSPSCACCARRQPAPPSPPGWRRRASCASRRCCSSIIRGFTRLSETKLAFDVVYILNAFFAEAGRAVESLRRPRRQIHRRRDDGGVRARRRPARRRAQCAEGGRRHRRRAANRQPPARPGDRRAAQRRHGAAWRPARQRPHRLRRGGASDRDRPRRQYRQPAGIARQDPRRHAGAEPAIAPRPPACRTCRSSKPICAASTPPFPSCWRPAPPSSPFSQKPLRLADERLAPVVVRPMARVLQRHHARIAEMPRPAVLHGVGGPGLRAIDQQGRAGDEAPQPRGVLGRHLHRRKGAQRGIELEAQRPVAVVAHAVARQMRRKFGVEARVLGREPLGRLLQRGVAARRARRRSRAGARSTRAAASPRVWRRAWANG